ncbi:MAG: hypothetical protein OHK0046_32150 [Anaerolineae bacterium]
MHDFTGPCALLRRIRQMTYDDVLCWRDYRLEYLRPVQGYPYYKLTRCGALVGIVDIRTPRRLHETQCVLAAQLAALGFRAAETCLIIHGATTPLDANKHRITHLFRLA